MHLGKVCPRCNIVVHAKEFNRSMRLRKVGPQCNTIVHVKRSVCDYGHAFTLKKRKAPCTAVDEPVNAMKCRNVLLSEEELLVMKQRDKVPEPTQLNLRDFVCQQNVKEHGLSSPATISLLYLDAGAGHGSIDVINIFYLLMTPFFSHSNSTLHAVPFYIICSAVSPDSPSLY